MALIVQKYGGSSLATPKHIRRAAARIREAKRSGQDIVVVASAMGRMTDHLILLAHKTVQRPPQRELDMLMTAGERISMSLLAMALHEEGIPAISFTGSQSGIVTTNHHTEARILTLRAHRIQEELARGKAVIIAGFQGVSEQKEITTLGRGGSDTTAVALAAALGAECCEILTDVNGLFSADPRLVPEAKLLSTCSYDEALELASLGAKMHPRSLEMARRYGVRLRICSAHDSQLEGTWIGEQSPNRKEQIMEETKIRGVTTRDGYHFFQSQIPLDRLFSILRPHRVHLRFLSGTSEGVSFLCEKEKAQAVREVLLESHLPFEEIAKVAVISAVGEGLSSCPDVVPDFLQAIQSSGAQVLLLCINALSASVAVPAAQKELATQAAHRRLIEEASS